VTLTTEIAIYAAVLSTIVFIWNVFVWWRTDLYGYQRQ
jgi:hypothetical protein